MTNEIHPPVRTEDVRRMHVMCIRCIYFCSDEDICVRDRVGIDKAPHDRCGHWTMLTLEQRYIDYKEAWRRGDND